MHPSHPAAISAEPAGERSADRMLELGGRSLMAAFFFAAGVRKLVAWGATVAYFDKLGLPMPEIALAISLVVELGGAVLLLLGWRTRTVALVLALFTFSAALIGHQFWAADAAQVNNQINHFLKVIGILGGLLHIAGVAKDKAEAA